MNAREVDHPPCGETSGITGTQIRAAHLIIAQGGFRLLQVTVGSLESGTQGRELIFLRA